MRWDFFYRHESQLHNPKDVPAECITLDLPADLSLGDALEAARAAGMPKGSHRTGCFEVQNDLGIYSQIDYNRIDLSAPAKAAKVVFKTWEQLEAEDD